MKLYELRQFITQTEGPRIEFKKTTGELREGLETICGMLNAKGGTVLFGAAGKDRLYGQQVSDQTIHEITAALQRFEPPAKITISRVHIEKDREVIVLSVEPNTDSAPFTFASVPYERVGNTTRKMSQAHYEELLLQRGHAKRRWENMIDEDLKLKDLDAEEILRTRAAAIEHRRISAGTSTKIGDILDRLGLRINGKLMQAAQVLYGTNFISNYPQCQLKMGRFRGSKITGDILDNKQERMNAFAMVREGMAFLDRILPLAARFPKMDRYDASKIFREDRLPIPADAMREILLNAVIHRDYSNYGGHVAIAVFDDRLEISSTGRLLPGITIKELSGEHKSFLRNPLIAETFHRTGAVEVWGRGTNRVIDACKQYGIAPPTFSETSGTLIVTFRATIGPETIAQEAPGLSDRQRTIVSLIHAKGSISNRDVREALGISSVTAWKEMESLVKSKIVIAKGKGRIAKYQLPL